MVTGSLVLMFGLHIFITKTVGACDSGWHFYEGSCFSLSTTVKSWGDAQNDCSAKGGKLAEHETKGALDFLRTLCRSVSVNLGFWIGGTDVEIEGTWKWSTLRKTITILDWNNGEPNNYLHGTSHENCLFLNKDNDAYKMNDRVCSNQYNFICETVPVSTTTPVSTEVEMASTTSNHLTTQKDQFTSTVIPSTITAHGTTSDHIETTKGHISTKGQWSTTNIEYTTTTMSQTTVNVATTRNSNTLLTSSSGVQTKTMVANEGENITLPCLFDPALTKTNILWKWIVNSEELPLPTLSAGGNLKLPNLLLTSVEWFHGGMYECHVSSNGGDLVYPIHLTVTTNGGLCPCSCNYRQRLIYWASQDTSNRTYEELLIELRPILTKIKDNLKLNETQLSSYIRSKTSAKDDRISATRIGYTGAVILGLVLGFVIVIDTDRLYRFIKRMYEKRIVSRKQ